MNDIRVAFMDCATCATDLLERREVAQIWNQPSALAEFSVAGLAGHLLRGVSTVEIYLDAPEPDGIPQNAPAYYHGLAITSDIASRLNREVRVKGEEAAEMGAHALGEAARALSERLGIRLADERLDRRLQVRDGIVISLDDYLRTRIVELTIHCDDLAHSIGLANAPEPSALAGTSAIDTLVELARMRHGDLAVLRALARRERDDIGALRVF